MSGCLGEVEDPKNTRDDFERPRGTDPTPETRCVELPPQETGIRLLRNDEIRAVLLGSFGEALFAEVEGSFALLGDDAIIDSIRGVERHATDNHALFLAQITQAIALRVDAQHDSGELTGCDIMEDACFERLVQKWSAPLYRRPLTAEEAAELREIHNDESIGAVAAFLLLSPSSLFLMDLGGEAADDVFAVIPEERAAAISFALIGQPPSAEFVTAVTRAGDDYDALVDAARALDEEALTTKVDELLTFYLGPRAFPRVNAPDDLLDGLPRDGLSEEMRGELVRFLADVTAHEGNQFERLMTSTLAFPETDRVAALYGLDAAHPEGIEVPDRPGVVLRAAMLSEGQHDTSPILRGLFVMERMLCRHLGLPDPEAVQARLAEVNTDARTQSTRERIQIVTGAPQCATCHDAINPFGYALEAFDPLGRPRDREVVYEDHEPVAEHEIDTAVVLPNGEEVSGAEEMAWSVAGDEDAANCFAERAVEQVRLRSAERGDLCTQRAARLALTGERASLADALIAATVTHALRDRVAPEETP